MRPDRVSLACAVASAALLLCLPAGAGAQGVSLRAAAGLDGVARHGRWMPVTVLVENTGAPASGRLTVRVGDQQASRDLELGAPARERVELHLRAPDAPDAMVQVRFDPGGVTVATPVRIVPSDAAFTLCVSAAGLRPAETSCTVTIEAAVLPSAWQGLDAPDRIVWAATAREQLGPAQQRAVARAEALRAWNLSTSMAPVPLAIPEARTKRGRATALAVFALLLLALAPVASRVANPALRLYITLAAIVGVAGAATLAAGRFGEGAAVELRETIVIRTGLSTPESSSDVRGVAIFPMADRFTLETTAEDPDLTITAGPPQMVASTIAGGRVRVAGHAAKHAALQYRVSGFLGTPPVELSGTASAVTLTNRTGHPLVNCAGSSGVSVDSTDAVAPDGTLTAQVAPDAVDPSLTCTMRVDTPAMTVDGARVFHAAAALLVADLRPMEMSR